MDKWEKYRLFIGKNADYYIEKFKKFEETGGALSWNWAAFFLGIVWMLYRKMYLYGVLAFLFSMLLGFIIGAVSPDNQLLALGVQIWLWVGFGAFGNYIYYLFAKSKIEQIEKNFPDETVQKSMLIKEGGVSLTAPLIFVFIILLVQIIVYSTLGQ